MIIDRTCIRKLLQKKYRDEYGLFVVEGEKGVREALAHADVQAIGILADKKDTFEEVMSDATGVDVLYLTERDLNKIKDTKTFSGILAVVKKPEAVELGAVILCLDQVSDPGNLGTSIRTADWYGVTSILLSEHSCDPFNPKTVRATMGSLHRSHIEESHDLLGRLEGLKQDGYTVIGLSLHGDSFPSSKEPLKKVVYVFGSESHGIRPEIESICDRLYSIERRGGAESLNLAVSVGIALDRMIL